MFLCMIVLQDSDIEVLQRQLQREDDDFARAVSLSLRVLYSPFFNLFKIGSFMLVHPLKFEFISDGRARECGP